MEAPEIESDFLETFASTLRESSPFPPRLNLDSEKAEQGLVKLVLTLVELIRQLLERQAIRRVEGGTLTKEEIERLGITFMKLAQKMEELKEHFGIDDLNIDLGPLGRLLD